MVFLNEKLGEANYFLAKMSETQNDRVVFGYNLSAFLSAFKSIADFLGKNKKNDLKLAGLEQKLTQDKEISFLSEVRDMTVHVSTIWRRAAFEETMVVSMAIETHVNDKLIRADGTEEPAMEISKDKKRVKDKDINKHSTRPKHGIARYQFMPTGKSKSQLRTKLKGRKIGETEIEEIISKDVVTLCSENIEKLEDIIRDLEKWCALLPKLDTDS